MRRKLCGLTTGKAWSLSGLMHGLVHIQDEEGRPLGEVRAPSDAKRGVPMVLRACPYKDERAGRPMNVSALEQMTHHLDAVLTNIIAFRRELGEGLNPWDAMFMSVLDQLTGPHRFLLTAEDGEARPVPAVLSVGHKLAAGFFGVLMKERERSALSGTEHAADVSALLAQVRDQKALIGLSEVCAGPPNLVERSARAFLDPLLVAPLVLKKPAEVSPRVTSDRVEVARILYQQIELGFAFGLFDRRIEAEFLRKWGGRLEPRNPFIRRRLVERRISAIEHPLVGRDAPTRALPKDLAWRHRVALARRFRTEQTSTSTFAQLMVATLIHERQGALTVDSTVDLEELAAQVVNYLRAYQSLVQAQFELEQSIRNILGISDFGGVKLSSLQRPLPRALDWMEALLGYRLICEPCAEPTLSLRSHLRHVPLRVEGASMLSVPPAGVLVGEASG